MLFCVFLVLICIVTFIVSSAAVHFMGLQWATFALVMFLVIRSFD